jgi:hypothetical protein
MGQMLDNYFAGLYKQVINFVEGLKRNNSSFSKKNNHMNYFTSLVLISIILVLVLIESQITVGWKREGVRA